MKFLGILFNISELTGKIIFQQFSLLQLWRHITLICISRWWPPYHKFLNFECKHLENQKWYWKIVNHVLSNFIKSSWTFFRFSLWNFSGFLPKRGTCYNCTRGCVWRVQFRSKNIVSLKILHRKILVSCISPTQKYGWQLFSKEVPA